MTTDQGKPIDPQMFLLALCASPEGVKARNSALDADVTLFADIDEAVRGDFDRETLLEGADTKVLFAVHLVAQVAISLLSGVRQMLPHNVYSANALIRQLVEVEYLAWACGYDSAEAVDWLTSDREARLKRWSPQRLRNRAKGHFDDQDYWDHCEAGGHPTPGGIVALHGATKSNPELAFMPEVTLYEATLHVTAIADYLTHAIPSQLPFAADMISRAHTTRAGWVERDPAARWKRDADAATRARAMLDIAVELSETVDPTSPTADQA